MWPPYLHPTIADQRPSQACFWLQLIPFYLFYLLFILCSGFFTWILRKLNNGHHSLLLAAAYTILPVIYAMMWHLYLNPTKADQWPSQACCWLQLLPFYLLFILCCGSITWIIRNLTNGHSKPAAGCIFHHFTCYFFYAVAPLPESYESWPMAITSVLLAAAFTVLLVIYSMLWPHYLNPTKADQWPSQACCWL